MMSVLREHPTDQKPVLLSGREDRREESASPKTDTTLEDCLNII